MARASTEFSDLFGPVPEALIPFLPRFRHALVDLVGIPDSELSADAALRLRLKALKYALRPDLARWLEVILADVVTLDGVDVVAVLIYLTLVKADVGEAAVRAALGHVAPSRTEEFMTSWVQAYVDQGVAKGEAKGRATTLLRLLRRRFGATPSYVESLVGEAESEQLDVWLDAVIDAPSLEAIFGKRVN